MQKNLAKEITIWLSIYKKNIFWLKISYADHRI